MSLGALAVTGLQALLGLVGLIVGVAKVSGQDDQIEEFRRFGYPQWFRVVTGVVEIGAGIALVAGIVWFSEFALAGGVLLSAVMAGAIVTHLRVSDPASRIAAPTVLLLLAVGLLTHRYLTFPGM